MSRFQRDTAAKEMHFFEHLRELRERLLNSLIFLAVGVIIGFLTYDSYISYFIKPFGESLYITRIEQGFTTKIKISIYAGIILSFPVHFYHVIAFLLPALTARERRILASFLIGSSVMVLIGGYLAYFRILPISIQFLTARSFIPDHVATWLDFRESMFFVLQLLLAFLALFQFPLILLLLMMMNIIDRHQLLRSSRYFIAIIFLLSAIITPPDVVSQIGLALPLILLYYVTILIAKLLRIGESKR